MKMSAMLFMLSVALAISAGAALVAAPALAATPETPETGGASALTATTAVLHGTLNPAAKSEGGSYQFSYAPSATECAPGTLAPVSPALSVGMEKEAVEAKVEGLEPNQEYSFCVIAYGLLGGTAEPSTPSAAVPFNTLPAPPKIDGESASGVTATEADLAAQVNPNNEETNFTFEYATKATGEKLEGTVVKVNGEGPLNGGSDQTASIPTIEGLTVGKTYFYRVVAENAQSKTEAKSVDGAVKSFTTALPPENPVTTGAKSVSPTEETLEGILNPGASATDGYYFAYSNPGGVSCAEGPRAPGGEQEVREHEVTVKDTTETTTVTGLEPHQKYVFCMVAANGAEPSETAQSATELSFETAAAKPTVESVSAPVVKATEVTLEGALNPNNESTECHFQYGTGSVTEHEIACAPTVLTGFEVLAVSSTTLNKQNETVSSITGLEAGKTYKYRLLAKDAAGEEAIESEFTTQPLTVGNEGTPTVTANEAVVRAEVGTGESDAKYYVQYGTGSVEELASAPEAHIYGSGKPVFVQQRLADLQPATTYHFRFVVSDGHAPVTGEELTFTTPGSTSGESTTSEASCKAEHPAQPPRTPLSASLPDCRAYELVSPTDTLGNDATEQPGGLVEPGSTRASEAREAEPAITYRARGGFSEAAGGAYETQLLARREPYRSPSEPGGWKTRSITAPLDEATVGSGYFGLYFTPELTEGLVRTEAVLEKGAESGLTQLYRANFADSSYQLISNIGEYEEKYDASENDIFPLGASTDGSHIAFEGGDGIDLNKSELYEFVNGEVLKASVSNAGVPWSASVGWSDDSGGPRQDVWHAMSADGTRVIFTSPPTQEGVGQLYVRQNAGVHVEPEPEREQSKMKDLGQPGEECLEPVKACTIKISGGEARYWGANTEDTKIFYTENGDLYEYSLPAGAVTGKAVALTSGGEVRGVMQVSEDGSYVYFVADGALASGAVPETCTGSGAGEGCNLYVAHYEHGAWSTKFIAALSVDDIRDWNEGPEYNLAVLSPSGSRLAFTSDQELTGYDNLPAEAGECKERVPSEGPETGKCREIYLYDAEANTLVCASCNPTGARPVGGASLSRGGVAANSGNYRPRALLKDGSLFFDSKDRLTSKASDALQNVYEYEGGRVYAISDPAGAAESFFLDASPSGEDVFFGSAERLTSEDPGGTVAVWDARVGGGFPVANVASCQSGESCKPPPTPQPGVFAPAGSATFNGPGNPATALPPAVVKKVTKNTVKCKKSFVKNNRGKCVKRKKSKQAKKSAHTNRRPSR